MNFVIEETELPDEEPFTLDNLNRYQFNTQLLNALIEESDINTVFTRARAAGNLPYGSFGELYWENQQEEMLPLAEQIRTERKESHSIELNIESGDTTLTGWMHQIQEDGLVRWRPAALTAVDGLLLWIEHLVYCAAGGEGESRMYGRKGTAWRYAPLDCDEARQYLQQLISGYQQGMCEPLLLLSKSGWAWLSQCFDRESGQILWDEEIQTKARMKLLQVWQGDQRIAGEGEDNYIQRVFRLMDNQHLDMILNETERYLLPIARHNKA